MKKYSKYIIPVLLLVYVLEVYGSLILSKYNIIDVLTWRLIHHIGICILLCSFFHLLKDRMNAFVYSLGISIFISRLITQLNGGLEHWYEMVSVIALTIVFHFINKNKNWIIKKIKSYGA